MDDLVSQLAAEYGMGEDEVRTKVGPLLERFAGGERSELLEQVSERLGGPAATGRGMGDLEGRMTFDPAEGGVIGGLGSMLGQSRGNEEPHTTFQDVADELATPANPRDVDTEDAKPSDGFREVIERDMTMGTDNPTDGYADTRALGEDDIIAGLEAAERQGIAPAEDRRA